MQRNRENFVASCLSAQSRDPMASSGDRSLVVGTRFFKIILHSTLRDKKLLIPGKYVGNVDDECLPESAVLKVPSGATWTVDVVRDEDGVWFGNGWQAFAEFHSLDFGHFLVFEYQGCSRFSVVICDKTAAEIAYPIPTTTCEANFVEELIEEDSSFDTRIRKKSKLLIEVCKPQVERKKKMRGSISAGNAAKVRSWQRIVSPSTQAEDDREGESKRMISEEPSRSRKCRAMTGFASPYPYFKVQITESMTKKQMHVPRSFATRHIAEDEKAVQLQVGDDSGWFVTLNRKSNKYVMFGGGWDRFANENSVKPGDVCVFECVRRWNNVLLKVTIVRDV